MRRTNVWKLAAGLAALGLVATGCATGDDDGEGTFAAVQDRGTLNCGVNDAVPGFGSVDEDGNFAGFDVDYCRAVAAAVLGDPDAVEFTPLTADERFTALQSGDIDVLIRNTTWTASRDGTEGSTFLTTTFYDGQGIMVMADSGISEIADLEGANVCVLRGTTTELNLTALSEARGLDLNPQSFEDNPQIQPAFQQGQCEGWTSDKSQLAGIRSEWPDGPEALTILDETISKEPLGPVVRDGDSQWAQIVDWAVIATIQAEEFGLTSDNIGSADTENPEIARFVGAAEGEEAESFDPGLGLPADYAVQVVEAVGNYAEIYNRNIGPDTPLGLTRGVNELWTNGGLHYPPPYR